MLVGEVGITRDEFLYQLKMWEVIAIQRGYHRRCSRRWEPARFVAFCTIKSMGGGKNIHSMQDLITFPWEVEHSDQPSDEEIKKLHDLVVKENEEFMRKQAEQK